MSQVLRLYFKLIPWNFDKIVTCKLRTESVFFHGTAQYQGKLLFGVHNIVYLYGLQISIVFPANSVKNLNLEIKRLNLMIFLWLAIFKIFEILAKYAKLEGLYPQVSMFETFALFWNIVSVFWNIVINYKFVMITKATSIKIRETFFEGL